MDPLGNGSAGAYTTLDFRPVVLDPRTRWRTQPFDLRFDAKWTHQPGCEVHMDDQKEVRVQVIDREAAHLSGMRFATGQQWVACSRGERVNVRLTLRSKGGGPVPYRCVYLPQDAPRSDFFEGEALPSEQRISFVLEMPAHSESATHLFVFEPLEDRREIVISEASMEIVEQ